MFGLLASDLRQSIGRIPGKIAKAGATAKKLALPIALSGGVAVASLCATKNVLRDTPSDFWEKHTWVAKDFDQCGMPFKESAELAENASRFTGIELHMIGLEKALLSVASQTKSKEDIVALLVAALEKFQVPLTDADWTPLEKRLLTASDVMAVVREEAFLALQKRWKAAGILDVQDEPKKKSLMPSLGVNYNLFAYGEDVGTKVPSFVFRHPEGRSLPMEEQDQLLDVLEEDGIVLLRNYVPEKVIDSLREAFKIKTNVLSAIRTGQKGFFTSGIKNKVIEDMCKEVSILEPTRGRRHFLLRGTPLEDIVLSVQAGVMPIVLQYLNRVRPGTMLAGLPDSERPYVSEVQLILQDPLAVDQFWHVTNTKPGVTVVVPLTNVRHDMGTEEVYIGTHRIFNCGMMGALKETYNSIKNIINVNGSVFAALEAGDAMILDSRLVHRGNSNVSFHNATILLVFRYDFKDCPPPGQNVASVFALTGLGNMLNFLTWTYRMLPPRLPLIVSGDTSVKSV